MLFPRDALFSAFTGTTGAAHSLKVGDVITVTADRVDGILDPLIVLTDESQQNVLAIDNDSGGDRNAPTNYDFPNQRVAVHWLSGLPLRTSSMRTLGGAANTFANESFMDELAAAAQIDPLEFRLRHMADPRAIAVLRAAAEQAGWGTSLPAGAGRGLAFAHYENEAAYVATVAQVQVDASSGAVRVPGFESFPATATWISAA